MERVLVGLQGNSSRSSSSSFLVWVPGEYARQMLSKMDNIVSFSVDYMLNAFEQYATKHLMLTAYLSTSN
jgi:hypothetical protein